MREVVMRKLFCLLAASVVLIAAAQVARVMATPASLFSGTTIALGRFGNINVANHAVSNASSSQKGDLWLSLQKTEGESDVYVQNNVWQPGGTTGWHTHPGHSLIIVAAGTLTAYEDHDGSCAAHVYTAGMGFVDPGGDHRHVIRNEGTTEARTITVQVIPAGATRRIDVAAPVGCPL
jgi:quercetin dioxygenase-like cupin family protein